MPWSGTFRLMAGARPPGRSRACRFPVGKPRPPIFCNKGAFSQASSERGPRRCWYAYARPRPGYRWRRLPSTELLILDLRIAGPLQDIEDGFVRCRCMFEDCCGSSQPIVRLRHSRADRRRTRGACVPRVFALVARGFDAFVDQFLGMITCGSGGSGRNLPNGRFCNGLGWSHDKKGGG